MGKEKLIELVQKHPILYDLTHEDYLNSQLKEKIWKKIGDQLQMPGMECKKTWNNVRDAYRKALKKHFLKSAYSEGTIKKYKYADQMVFLKPFIHDKEIFENTAYTEENDDENSTSACSMEKNRFGGKHTISTNKIEKIRSLQGRKKKREELEGDATIFMKYITEKSDKQSNLETNHPVDTFLSALSPTLKTFTPYYLNLAKTKIFATVQSYEMEMIMANQDKQHFLYSQPDESKTITACSEANALNSLEVLKNEILD